MCFALSGQSWDLQSFCSAILSAQMKSNYNKIMYINLCTMQIERALLQSGKWWLISYYSVLSIYPTQWLGGNCRSFCTLYLLYVHCKWASFTRKDLAKLLYHDIFTLWKNIHYSKIKIHGVWHQSFLTMSHWIYTVNLTSLSKKVTLRKKAFTNFPQCVFLCRKTLTDVACMYLHKRQHTQSNGNSKSEAAGLAQKNLLFIDFSAWPFWWIDQ